MPDRSGTETAYNSIDGWPKASGAPTKLLPSRNRPQGHSNGPRSGGTQSKTGRGSGQSPANQAQREALASFTPNAQSNSFPSYVLDDSQITSLIQFFQTLDRWDKEAHGPHVM